jgi:hypothetical protein
MINSGTIGMPLHFGKVPNFLLNRMGLMGEAIIESIVDNYGKSEVLTRMSDPNWFQAFGAVMGMHWNSSGVTATVLGSLKRRINPKASDLGIYILGGKGKQSWYAPKHIERLSKKHELDGTSLSEQCSLTRRIDGNAVQDGFNLYQHYFLLSDEGEWTSISQGMNKQNRRARRYHWHSPTVKSFVSDPHTGIVGQQNKQILNLVDSNAETLRNNMLSLVREDPQEIKKVIRTHNFEDRHDIKKDDVNLARLGSVLDLAYQGGINKFEDLVMLHGMGPRTLKSVALASEVIHGDSTRFDDPARFSFAVGGKDGVPHPINVKALDETIEMLQTSVEKSKVGDKEKSKALKRLHTIAVQGESKGTPLDFLKDFIDSEWSYSEKSGGKTFLGPVVKGITRNIMEQANGLLYKNKNKNKKD